MDPKPLFEAVGEYVLCFAWLENVIWQTATFAKYPEQDHSGRWALLDFSFAELVRTAEQAIPLFVDAWAPRQIARDFKRRVSDALDKCGDVRRQRNRFLHSAYVHLEAGGELMAIMRSYITWRGVETLDAPVFDQEIATPDAFRSAMKEVAEVGVEISACRLQLIHWYRRADYGVQLPD
jgi:hypothetical protein